MTGKWVVECYDESWWKMSYKQHVGVYATQEAANDAAKQLALKSVWWRWRWFKLTLAQEPRGSPVTGAFRYYGARGKLRSNTLIVKPVE